MIIFLVVIVIIVAVGGMFMIKSNSDGDKKSKTKNNNLTNYSGLVPDVRLKQNKKTYHRHETVNDTVNGTYTGEKTITSSPEETTNLVEFNRNVPIQLER